MANDDKKKTELLDKLEGGPWPSFVKEIKKAAETSAVCDDLLGQLELSYEEKKGHWKHGGIVGVLGYGGGRRGSDSSAATEVICPRRPRASGGVPAVRRGLSLRKLLSSQQPRPTAYYLLI